jgi:hypothetical protein
MAEEDNIEKGQTLLCREISFILKLKRDTNKPKPKKDHLSLHLRGITSKFRWLSDAQDALVKCILKDNFEASNNSSFAQITKE